MDSKYNILFCLFLHKVSRDISVVFGDILDSEQGKRKGKKREFLLKISFRQNRFWFYV